MSSEKKILYHNDYSPRYRDPYNIYDKAREHMKQLKKERKSSQEISSQEKKK